MKPTHILAAGLGPGMVLGRVLSRQAVACEFEFPANSGDTCESFTAPWLVSIDDFKKLNPGVACPDLLAGQIYCLIGTVTNEPVTTMSTQSPGTSSATSTTTQSPVTTSSSTSTPVTTTTTRTSTIATRTSTTTTLPGNGVTTPVPTQPGMVGNCNKFHLVEQDQTCADIAARYSISTTNFIQWNPAAKSDCTGLWASTYACVGIIGGTPTQPSNGIETPSPAHPGMVSNCDKFVYVNPGDTCDVISFWNDVGGGQWVKLWNGLSEDCRGLQAHTYACIGVIGGTPTQPGNGITTPVPTQPGMVSNCNKFYKVSPGETCDHVAFWGGAPGTEWVMRWNPGVGPDCRTLQAHTYACVGVM